MASRAYVDVGPVMGERQSRGGEAWRWSGDAPVWDLRVFEHRWSEADLERLPDDGHRYEIIDGNLIVSPPPTARHQAISLNLILILRDAAPEGWRVSYEVGIRVPHGNLICDVAVLHPDVDIDVSRQEPGDVGLVVEIASPSTEIRDQGDKLIAYAEAGIPAYWRVGRDGVVTAYRLVVVGEYETVATVKPGEVFRAEVPFPVAFDPATLTNDL